MSDDQPVNAALTTAMAFHYQALVGLDKCFSLKKDQAIWYEKDGDVSLLGTNIESSTQTEVKDYAAPLTDHHENLWKTLKNWLENKFQHDQYGALILLTTQSFGVTTRLKDWNTQTAMQRLQTLKDIYDTRTNEEINASKPTQIVKFQKTVIEAEHSLLIAVLEKTTLVTEADDAKKLESNVISKITGIPKNNLKNYLQGLIGFIYEQGDKTSWCIDQEAFHAKCEELTTHFCKKEFTFPPFTGYEASDLELESHKGKLFVQKITEISHSEVISDAVGNWIELQNSLLSELDGYPRYAVKTKFYQKQLIKNFKLYYSSAQLEVVDKIKSSKLLYNKTISEPPLHLGNDTPPMDYKNGLIHDAMDNEDDDLKWSVDS